MKSGQSETDLFLYLTSRTNVPIIMPFLFERDSLMATLFPLKALRTLALYTQHLATPLKVEGTKPNREDIYGVIEQIMCVQIDTLQMVHRSQYLAIWSRLGNYEVGDLDTLVYSEPRRLFEYWLHAACIMPLNEYRYRLPSMGLSDRQKKWLTSEGNAQLVEHVRDRIEKEGPLRSADFQHDKSQRGTWWNWKPAKRALELLYDKGELMIANRVNFQRCYDLTSRVLPKWVDTASITAEEARRYVLERSVRALGVCQPHQAANYTHMRLTLARPLLEDMVAKGTLNLIQGELADGTVGELVVHRDNIPLLYQAADEAIKAQRVSFLSPFDNLFWAKGRDEQFWGFVQRLEAYKPAAQRIWGYFCLPILYHDRLIGRFDPKLERREGRLRIKSLHLEPGVTLDETMIADIASAMQDFLAFHAADDVTIEDTCDFGQRLLNALT